MTSQSIETYSELFSETSSFCLRDTLQYIRNSSKETVDSKINDRLKQLNDFINQEGDGESLKKEVFGYVRKYLNSYHEAEEVTSLVQETVWIKKSLYDPSRNFRPWLFTIATRLCIDYQRKNKKHKRIARLDEVNTNKAGDENEECCYLDILESRSEETAGDKEDRGIVRKSLSMLPENSRQVLELVYFQGLKYRGAAEIIGIPIGTVKSRIHNAINHLRESPLIRKLNEAA